MTNKRCQAAGVGKAPIIVDLSPAEDAEFEATRTPPFEELQAIFIERVNFQARKRILKKYPEGTQLSNIRKGVSMDDIDTIVAYSNELSAKVRNCSTVAELYNLEIREGWPTI